MNIDQREVGETGRPGTQPEMQNKQPRLAFKGILVPILDTHSKAQTFLTLYRNEQMTVIMILQASFPPTGLSRHFLQLFYLYSTGHRTWAFMLVESPLTELHPKENRLDSERTPCVTQC